MAVFELSPKMPSSARIALALALAVFGRGVGAQESLSDPLPDRIEKGDAAVAAVDFVRAPRSVDVARPGATNRAYARIQYLLPVPGGRRLAFNDTRGFLYFTDVDAKPPSVYLDLRSQASGFSNAAFPNEAGFMGFAFHPQFAMPGKAGYGKFYTAFSAEPESGDADYEHSGAVQHSVIREWTATDPSADVFDGTSREVLRVGQFAANHNVGTIAFNPNADESAEDYGLLYICFGDGGSAHDPRNHGQTLRAPLGAIARIDPFVTADGRRYGIPAGNPFVGRPGVAEEIWAYGLRHPQQFSWDADGRMFIADIGQDQIEEINLGVAGGNYGWRLREGTFATARGVGRTSHGPVFPLPANDPASFIYPVAQYDHDEGFAVGGGYVYRGTVAALRGKYVFTDFPRGRVFTIDAGALRPGESARIDELRLTIDGREQDLVDVAGFYNTYTGGQRVDARLGTDHDGELYVLTKGDGWIRKLVGPAAPESVESTYRVPLFLAASRAPQQGFVRIVNHSSAAGTVTVTAIDDAGRRTVPFALPIAAKETKHFNSDDLEVGNPSKGLAEGVGAGTGDWRLELTSALHLEVLAYVRTGDGLLTSMHATVRKPGSRHLVPIFNPASNTNQVSSLRMTNASEEDANVAIVGVDDSGRQSGEVRFALAAGQAHALSAQQLEAGASTLNGNFGNGSGKWRLYVSADQPLHVMNLLASPTGHITNLSSSTADADHGLPSEATSAERQLANFHLADENGHPAGIAFANGRFYVVDHADDKVYAYSTYGQRAPTTDFELSDDHADSSRIVAANDRLYIVDSGREEVAAYTTAGERVASFRIGPRTATGVAYADNGLYIVDAALAQVVVYSTDGERDEARDFQLADEDKDPIGIAYANGRFHVANADGSVDAYTRSGQRDARADFRLDGRNPTPAGMAFANDGFYVLDRPSAAADGVGVTVPAKVYAYAPNGELGRLAEFNLDGSNDGVRGMTHAENRFYVVDAGHKVYAYRDGRDGGERDQAADFDLGADNQEPRGIAHAAGKLYVPDGAQHKVFAYALAGERDAPADFDLNERNQAPAAIAYAKGMFYVLDEGGSIFPYTAAGELDSAEEFALNVRNVDPVAIAYANGRLYVVDDSGSVFAYTTVGEHDAFSDFALLQPDAAQPRGVAAAGGRLHVLDGGKVRAYGRDLHRRHIPLLTSASNAAQQGFVRIVNHSARAGTVAIRAVDDSGTTAAPILLSIGPWEAKHFNSTDLERGNLAKGIRRGTGAGSGDWRLRLESDVDVEALAYIRTMDGFLTSVHDTAPVRGGWRIVPIFNPGSNRNQASRLRLVNRTASDLEVAVVGDDDSGARSPVVRLALAAGKVREISAWDLESGGLGDGKGKWYLFAAADAPIEVLSLLESTSGHLTNLSASSQDANEAHWRRQFLPDDR